jgi:hypothetical protein
MKRSEASQAFADSTVISTRRDGAIEGCIMRRRKLADGTRVTTGEVSEAMIELLLKTPGGLVRRNTALNPDMIAKAVELHTAGRPRKEAEAELGISAATYRRLLAEGGVTSRKYNAILTDANVERAVRIAAHYDLTKRGDIIKASKDMGVNSRTLRRLLQRALVVMTLEQIATLRHEEKQKAAEAAGQLSMEVTNVSEGDAGQVPAVVDADAPVDVAPVEVAPSSAAPVEEAAATAALVEVSRDAGATVREVTPETVALHPGDPGFVERRMTPQVDVAAITAVATQAVAAAVAAAIPAAMEAATHPAQ